MAVADPSTVTPAGDFEARADGTRQQVTPTGQARALGSDAGPGAKAQNTPESMGTWLAQFELGWPGQVIIMLVVVSC